MNKAVFVCNGFGKNQTDFQDIMREAVNESFTEWLEVFEEFDFDLSNVQARDLFRGLGVIAGLLNDSSFEGAVNITIDELTGDFEVAPIYPAPIEFMKRRSR